MNPKEVYIHHMEELKESLCSHINTAKEFCGKSIDELSPKELEQFILLEKIKELNDMWDKL